MFRRRGCRQCGRPCERLDEAAAGDRALVMQNPDRKTRELGIFRGCIIDILKNEPADSALVIAVSDSRYVIAKHTAQKICIKIIGAGEHDS